MGIQPIDLQTMYTQLSNVSKSMSGAQQAQLTEAMQQQGNIQRSMENAAKVQQTSNEKAETNTGTRPRGKQENGREPIREIQTKNHGLPKKISARQRTKEGVHRPGGQLP